MPVPVVPTKQTKRIPPLKPFEGTDPITDIYDDLACIAISRLICIAPLANAVELQGELAREARLRGSCSLVVGSVTMSTIILGALCLQPFFQCLYLRIFPGT